VRASPFQASADVAEYAAVAATARSCGRCPRHPKGESGASRSTPAWQSHDFADAIRRAGTSAPRSRGEGADREVTPSRPRKIEDADLVVTGKIEEGRQEAHAPRPASAGPPAGSPPPRSRAPGSPCRRTQRHCLVVPRRSDADDVACAPAARTARARSLRTLPFRTVGSHAQPARAPRPWREPITGPPPRPRAESRDPGRPSAPASFKPPSANRMSEHTAVGWLATHIARDPPPRPGRNRARL